MSDFQCSVRHCDALTKARVTEIHTPHGSLLTPAFMPVGTRAGVNNLMPHELQDTGSQIILGGNTYHMLCAPGMEVIERAGGMHPFMGWHGPMLTDSGGFQLFSLSKNEQLCVIDETGAHFKLPDSNRLIHMTPEMSLETQKIIGADIIMAFDQCTPEKASFTEAKAIMERTHRWLQQSVDYHHMHPTSRYGKRQALFGIIQGGIYPELREISTEFVVNMALDGIAIGGETIGFDMQKTVELLAWMNQHLPENKPRYTMGVGMSPQDLLDVVAMGVDLFDCVAPTRNARHGGLYTGELIADKNWLKFQSPYANARLQIKKAEFVNDETPVMASCTCQTCQQYSRAHLHYLFKNKADVFTALASRHNIHVMQAVCAKMRELIQLRSIYANTNPR